MMETKQKYLSPESEIIEMRITQGMLTGSQTEQGQGQGGDFEWD